jgi:hypothetical protein
LLVSKNSKEGMNAELKRLRHNFCAGAEAAEFKFSERVQIFSAQVFSANSV